MIFIYRNLINNITNHMRIFAVHLTRYVSKYLHPRNFQIATSWEHFKNSTIKAMHVKLVFELKATMTMFAFLHYVYTTFPIDTIQTKNQDMSWIWKHKSISSYDDESLFIEWFNSFSFFMNQCIIFLHL